MGSYPVYDRLRHEVVSTKSEVGSVWRRHFKKLATDVSGVYRDASKWPDTQGPPLSWCEDPIDWSEIIHVLKKTRWNEAPGIDGISADV